MVSHWFCGSLGDLDERIYKGSLEANARSKSIEIAAESQVFFRVSFASSQVEANGSPGANPHFKAASQSAAGRSNLQCPKVKRGVPKTSGFDGAGGFTVVLSGYLELAIQIEAVQRINLSPIYPH